jgi:hypothetical protein
VAVDCELEWVLKEPITPSAWAMEDGVYGSDDGMGAFGINSYKVLDWE